MVAVVVLTSDRRLTVSGVLALGECMLNSACMHYIGERVLITILTACFKQDTSHAGGVGNLVAAVCTRSRFLRVCS